MFSIRIGVSLSRIARIRNQNRFCRATRRHNFNGRNGDTEQAMSLKLKLNLNTMLLAGGCFNPLGFGVHCTRIAALASPWPPPVGFRCSVFRGGVRRRSVASSSTFRSNSAAGEVPIVPDCLSQQEDDRQLPSEELSSVAGGIVALGKFDALHIGHRELAIQASKVGVPFLLSFVGMAEVLGWEPRAPIVAKCDRQRVLNSWAPYCGNVTPKEYEINFSTVRHLSPRLFVEKLSKELGVHGVVAGENYRFGYKATGDAQELTSLCDEYNLKAYIINSVMDKNQNPRIISIQRGVKERGQVSSTRVRHALAVGDVKYVSQLLGRKHRLILRINDLQCLTVTSSRVKVSAPTSWLLNLPPKEGLYEDCAVFCGEEGEKACRVVVERNHVHLEINGGEGFCNFVDNPKEMPILGVEFG